MFTDKDDKTERFDQKPTGIALPNKREYKRKAIEEYNGQDSKDEDHKNKKIKKKFKNDDDLGEALYCLKCDISFSSLPDHMKTYHNNFEVVLQVRVISRYLYAKRDNVIGSNARASVSNRWVGGRGM